jgi:hypothetical protein
MAKKTYAIKLTDEERRLLLRMTKIEKGRLSISATIGRLITDEASRTGLLKKENDK